MTAEQEREANELVTFLHNAVRFPGVAGRSDVKRPLLSQADKLLKVVDGQPRNELEIARANLATLGK